ncbi:MAG: YybH family protein [Candidatus Eisenbacteria bacterium]
MKRIVRIIAAALVLAPLAAGTPPPARAADTASPLDTLVMAERAFAARSAESGMKRAFLLNLAPDAIIFKPGPVNGVPVWAARPESKYQLLWEPSWAEIAGNGDLGFTTGPWVLKPPDRDTVVAQGHFMTVWRRGGDEPWMVAVDLGIEHAPPEHGGVGDVTLEPGAAHHPVIVTEDWPRSGASLGVGIGNGAFGFGLGTSMSPQQMRERIMAHEVNAMMNADRTYVYDRRGKGPAEALSKAAASDLRMYRSDRMPAHGPMEAIELLKALPPAVELLPYGSRVSSSFDIGYSYGLVLSRVKNASRADTSGYVHAWRRDDTTGKWKLIFDVETAYPKR